MPFSTIKIILVCVILGLGSGCKEFLTVPALDDLSRAELFASIRGADAAVVGLYGQLRSSYTFRLPLYADLQGNMVPLETGTASNGDFLGVQRGFVRMHARDLTADLDGTGMPDVYEEAYEILFQANDIINAIPELTEGPEDQQASLLAEARAMRAFVHFQLVQLFAQAPGFSPNGDHLGIVLIREVPGIFALPARNTVAEVYASIRLDLEAALADLNEDFSRRSDNRFWLTPAVVNGLLARVSAFQQDWMACRDFAAQAIELSSLALTPPDGYLEQWGEDGVKGEVLWELDLQRLLFDDSDVPANLPSRIIGAGAEEPLMQVAPALVDLYPADDLRRGLFVEDDEGRIHSGKWPVSERRVPNIPLLQLSDLYLLRAEANVELGSLEAGRADLRRIYERALPDGADLPVSQDSLRAAVRLERRRELAFEGHHFFDLTRWGADLVRENCRDIIPECTINYPDDHFVLPIPLDALFDNPNLEQNPGY